MLSKRGVSDRFSQRANCPRASPASSANRDCSPLASQLLLRFVKNCSQGGRAEETLAERNSSKAWTTHLCHSMISGGRGTRAEVGDPNHVLQRGHSSRADCNRIKDCRLSQPGQYSYSWQ